MKKKTAAFVEEYGFENIVLKMSAIVSGDQYVNSCGSSARGYIQSMVNCTNMGVGLTFNQISAKKLNKPMHMYYQYDPFPGPN